MNDKPGRVGALGDSSSEWRKLPPFRDIPEAGAGEGETGGTGGTCWSPRLSAGDRAASVSEEQAAALEW